MGYESSRIARAFARRGVAPQRTPGGETVGIASRDAALPDWHAAAATTPPDVRCPQCDKKLGTRLVGTYETICPRCHSAVKITR